jgi:glycosyltransferase involved in cell wall biosynthesis
LAWILQSAAVEKICTCRERAIWQEIGAGKACTGDVGDEFGCGVWVPAAEIAAVDSCGISALLQASTEALIADGTFLTSSLPDDLFAMAPQDGVPILKNYLNSIPQGDRYAALEPLIRSEWKWFCRAAPYLDFPEPKPLPEGQPINIGIRIQRLSHGGAERAMQSLANHFAAKPNYNVTVFINASDINAIDYPVSVNVRVVPVKEPIGWDGMLQEYPQDLLVCPEHWIQENFQNILLLKLLGMRVFAAEHGGPTWHAPFEDVEEKFAHLGPLYSVCDGTHVLCKLEEDMWRNAGVPTAICLPNMPTFDVESVKPSNLDSKRIIWIGRWDSYHKNPELAIDAFAKILKKVPDAKLIMRGGGGNNDCFQQCKKRVRKLKISRVVDIGGFEKNLEPIYNSGAILLCSSRFEGFHLGIVEAKTFGLPIVSTEIPQLETLKRGCVLAPQNNPDALANAAIGLLLNGKKRKKLGAEARADVVENFSGPVVSKKYEEVFDAILKGKDAMLKLCAPQ